MTVTADKKIVLYIDKDPAGRLLVNRTLRYAGFQVLVAERGLEGIDVVRTRDVDLILTDIELPDVTGRELTTMLRSDERFMSIPVVALTEQGESGEQRDLAMAAGITGYLTKPLDVEALPRQLEYYLQGGHDIIDEDRLAQAKLRYTKEVVTHLEARIRELEANNAKLRDLDEVKDSFLQITAHELRTPLTLIYGYSRLLQETPEMKNIPGTIDLLDGLVEAIERMQGIVNEILTISRIMTDHIDLTISHTNMVQLLQGLIDKYAEAIASRHLDLHMDTSNFPASIRADNDMLRLVMDNLLSNAIKYTPDGGKIRIFARLEGPNVHIHFKDTGIGISEDEIDLIFTRFHTGNDPRLHSTSKTAFSGGGLGLGLSICKGIIEAHGGTIVAKSEKRDRDNPPGSEFIVTLPLAAKSTSTNNHNRN